MSSSNAVSEPDIPMAHLVYTNSTKGSSNPAEPHRLVRQWDLVKWAGEISGEEVFPLSDLPQSGVDVGHEGGLGLAVSANISKYGDRSEPTIRLLDEN